MMTSVVIGKLMETDWQQEQLLQEAVALIEKLSIDRRANLVERVLGTSSELKVVLAKSLSTAQVIFQIQQMDGEQISEVLAWFKNSQFWVTQASKS